MAMRQHRHAQALARAAGSSELYWLLLCVDPRGLAAAVLALTLYRGYRDTGYLDEVGADWLASADRVRAVQADHPALTVEEAQMLALSDPSAREADDAAVERGFRRVGLGDAMVEVLS